MHNIYVLFLDVTLACPMIAMNYEYQKEGKHYPSLFHPVCFMYIFSESNNKYPTVFNFFGFKLRKYQQI